MPPKKRKKPRAKAVKLNPKVWVRQSDVGKVRDAELFFQEGRCAITGIPLNKDNSVLDHCHADGEGFDGKLRGVLLSEVNCLEGKFLKQFKKFKLKDKYGLSFAQTLINMGEYLLQDNSNKKYHYRYMTDLRKHIETLRKDQITTKLKDDFGVIVDVPVDKKELVRLYVQTFVDFVESKENFND